MTDARHGARARTWVAGLLATATLLGVAAAPTVAQDDPASRAAPVSSASLLEAPVPSLCGFPAGRLSDGHLPGPDGYGGAWLSEPSLHAFGDLDGSPGVDAAAVVRCNHGGVGWPDNVVVWDSQLRVLGSFTTSDLTGGERDVVTRLARTGSTVRLDVVGITRSGDASCCGSRDARVALRYDPAKSRVAVVGRRLFDERRSAARTERLAEKGRWSALREVAARRVQRDLRQVHRHALRTRLDSCIGVLDGSWPSPDALEWAGASGASRGCLVSVFYRHDRELYRSVSMLAMKRTGFGRWRAVGLVGIAG